MIGLVKKLQPSLRYGWKGHCKSDKFFPNFGKFDSVCRSSTCSITDISHKTTPKYPKLWQRVLSIFNVIPACKKIQIGILFRYPDVICNKNVLLFWTTGSVAIFTRELWDTVSSSSQCTRCHRRAITIVPHSNMVGANPFIIYLSSQASFDTLMRFSYLI